MFGSIPGLYPSNTSSNPSTTTPRLWQLKMSSGGRISLSPLPPYSLLPSPPPALRTMDVDYIDIRISGASLVAQTVKRIYQQFRRHRFDPWVGKIPWRREWLSTPIFLPGKSHGQRSLVGYSLWGHRVKHNWVTNTSTFWFFQLVGLGFEIRSGQGAVPPAPQFVWLKLSSG